MRMHCVSRTSVQERNFSKNTATRKLSEVSTIDLRRVSRKHLRKCTSSLLCLPKTRGQEDNNAYLVERCITIKKKVCPPKDCPMPKAERKYMPLPLVGPLNVLNHTCAKHYNVTWKRVSGKMYKCTLKGVVKKCGQMVKTLKKRIG
eukprot:1309692-Ditylum_brightwellii.AAC.1